VTTFRLKGRRNKNAVRKEKPYFADRMQKKRQETECKNLQETAKSFFAEAGNYHKI